MKSIFKVLSVGYRRPVIMKQPATLLATSIAALAATAAVATPAHADRRSFTRTYEYMTMPEGETEVELYTEQSRAVLGEPSPQGFAFQVEVEHGITNRWDVSLYHVFKQSTGPAPGDDVALHFDEVKLRTRYRLSERGELPVNMLGYAELVKAFGAGEYKAELKGIFTRDFGKLTAAVNLIGEVVFGPSVDETELEAGWAAGLSYEVAPEIKLGAETWAGFEIEHPDELAASVGPAMSWAPSSGLWITTTAGFGVTEYADDVSVRAIIGLHVN